MTGNCNYIPETTDDILAKYRKKPQGILVPSNENHSGAVGGATGMGTNEQSHVTVAFSVTNTKPEKRFSIKEEETEQPHYDPSNLENCFAFVDAKRKLRIVLSSAEFQVGYAPIEIGYNSVRANQGNDKKEINELEQFLNGQLAEAINLQNKHLIAQLHEAIRCVKMFDSDG